MARKKTFTSTQMTWIVSAWLVIAYNMFFWESIWSFIGGTDFKNILFLSSLFFVAIALTNFILNLFTFAWVTRVTLVVVLLLSSLANYYMNQFNVLIDAEMIQNIFETDIKEAAELLSIKTVTYFFLLGVLPSYFVIRHTDTSRSFLKEVLAKLISFVVSFAIMFALIAPLFPGYASLARNHRDVRLMLNPFNYIQGTYGYVNDSLKTPITIKPIGEDAKKSAAWVAAPKKSVFILVVGETARSANFSLSGYARETNPELKQRDIVYFKNMHSCGTATAVSLPCMFSNIGRENFGSGKQATQQGLLDVLSHADFSLLWRDNNSGCKSACDRIPNESLAKLKLADFCKDGECYDEILLNGLQEYLDKSADDNVIVLHQKGSHGPAYYLRVPAEFEKFQPVCKTSELQKCSQQDIINAYDNTILYTDHVLAKIIDFLNKNSDKYDTGMLYVSDHGESLGENNLYLHGSPYAIAPKTQTHIPMLLWLSNGFRERAHIDWSCMKQHQDEAYSHYHLFHSVLGLMDVDTAVYQQGLDIFHSCKCE